MLSADDVLEGLSSMGVELFTGVPCSLLQPIVGGVESDCRYRYVAAPNEGDAVGIACGASLAGSPSAVLMQNSGLGNAVNPITSLVQTFRVPLVFIVSLRGDPQAKEDAPQHRLMGRMTTDLLDLMEIPWTYLPSTLSDWGQALDDLKRHLLEGRSFALVVRRDVLKAETNANESSDTSPGRGCKIAEEQPVERVTRTAFLETFQSHLQADDVVVSSTGHLSRALFTHHDRAGNFYMVGSMGCAAAIGLGLALTQPQRRIFVLDGDAALTMRLGVLLTVGQQAPENFHHMVLDNGVNASTGGQLSPSAGVDFCQLAGASGYRDVSQYPEVAWSQPGPTLTQVRLETGQSSPSSRPNLSPEELRKRFEEFLSE